MEDAFHSCISLVTALEIPKSVTILWGIFEYCEKLENMPGISENVTDMLETFRNCIRLKVEAIINANPKDCRFYNAIILS